MAVIFDDCISKKIVGHVPFNWSKLASMFLKAPNSCIRGTVTWKKRVNRGAGLGLEILMNYTFYGDARVVLWLEKALKRITESIDAEVETCLEQLHCSKYLRYHEFYRYMYSSDNSGPGLGG